jgi:hypothetical protein
MLNEIVENNRYELIRDAIGRVLKLELDNQNTLIDAWNEEHEGDEGFVAKKNICSTVFLERYENIDDYECPLINVVYAESNHVKEATSFSTIYDNRYAIEVYTSSPTNSSDLGYKIAAKELSRTLGVIRSILMNNQNLYLDFVEKFIVSRNVRTMARTEPRLQADAHNIISGMVEVVYRAEEITELQSGELETFLTSVIKISDTDKGYKLITQKL